MTEQNASIGVDIRKTGERGVALVIALLAMVVISGLGFTLVISSSTESMINASFRRAGLAHYSAMGGVEEMRGRMGPDARPIAADLTSVRIPCSPPSATCPPLYDEATRTTDLTQGYYIRTVRSIQPARPAPTWWRGIAMIRTRLRPPPITRPHSRGRLFPTCGSRCRWPRSGGSRETWRCHATPAIRPARITATRPPWMIL